MLSFKVIMNEEYSHIGNSYYRELPENFLEKYKSMFYLSLMMFF